MWYGSGTEQLPGRRHVRRGDGLFRGVDVSTIHGTPTARKLTTGTDEQSDMCTYFYDNYDRLHIAWAHFIEGRLASDCDVEKGVHRDFLFR